MTVKKKTKEELIESLLLNNIIKFLKEEDTDNALHFVYAYKMWKKGEENEIK